MPLALLNVEGKTMKLRQFSLKVRSYEQQAGTYPVIIKNVDSVAAHLQYHLI